MRRAARAIQRDDHQVYVEIVPPVPLEVNAMQEGEEAPGVRPGPSLSGADICAPGQRLTPPRKRLQHKLGLPTPVPLAIKLITPLQ